MVSSDMFSGFFYQICVVSPAISWILQPGRFSKRKGFWFAVSFLVVLSSISIGLELSEQESNFYHVVGVGRDASFADVKKAFRARSIDLHPDKNPSPTAMEDFNRLRLAFDVLGDAQKRHIYDLFGEKAVEKELSNVQIEAVIGTLSFYAVWAILTYVLTLSESARDARAWSFAGGVLSLTLEVNLIFGGLRQPANFFPFMTVFEFTKILRLAFPSFVNGCRAIGGYFYHDLAKANFQLGVELLRSNQAILLQIRELQGEVASSSRRRPEPSKIVKPDALPAAARKRLKFEKNPGTTTVSAPSPSAGAGTAAGEQPLPPNEQELYNPAPPVQKPTGFAIPKFVYIIGIYFVVNYVLQ